MFSQVCIASSFTFFIFFLLLEDVISMFSFRLSTIHICMPGLLIATGILIRYIFLNQGNCKTSNFKYCFLYQDLISIMQILNIAFLNVIRQRRDRIYPTICRLLSTVSYIFTLLKNVIKNPIFNIFKFVFLKQNSENLLFACESDDIEIYFSI